MIFLQINSSENLLEAQQIGAIAGFHGTAASVS
jgi:hypothetical protein